MLMLHSVNFFSLISLDDGRDASMMLAVCGTPIASVRLCARSQGPGLCQLLSTDT
jgi:hypothetical protein